MSRFVFTAVAVMVVATSAFAAEYYVGQNAADKTCKIMQEKPDGKTWIMIGTTSYGTKEEAKAAKRASGDCVKLKTKRPS